MAGESTAEILAKEMWRAASLLVEGRQSAESLAPAEAVMAIELLLAEKKITIGDGLWVEDRSLGKTRPGSTGDRGSSEPKEPTKKS